jgi:hypothetical protein
MSLCKHVVHCGLGGGPLTNTLPTVVYVTSLYKHVVYCGLGTRPSTNMLSTVV